MKRSYMKDYFLKMLLVITVLVGILASAITGYSKKVMEKEIISLHQSILNQSVHHSKEIVAGLKDTMETIAENSDVIEWISGHQEYGERVHSFIQNEIFGNYQKGNKFRIYIYNLRGVQYKSDDILPDWNEVQQYIKTCKPVLTAVPDEGLQMVGPITNEKEAGLYRRCFYLVNPIRDLINGEIRGHVLMQLSETGLYDGYKDLISGTRDYCIIDENSIVVSSKRKQNIGAVYDKNDVVISGQDFLSSGYGISDSHKESVYFYENIPGTRWYLLENADLRPIFESVDRASVFSIVLIGIFVICFLPITFHSLRTILYPIDSIKNKMSCVADGNLEARIGEDEKGKGELSEIADSFNYMVDKLEEQIEEIKQINHKRHLLRLDFLQTQINPHFIYNTLSSIRFYVEMGKNEEAEKMLIDFSKILRKILSTSEQFITLKEELETIQYYIHLQKSRYRDRFEVHFDIDEDTVSCIVPDFIMQPIVENAIFYSLKGKQICHIWIRSYVEEDKLCISIRDDGVGMGEDKINQVLTKGMNMNKVGMRNVHERLQLHYGEAYGLRVISEEGVGTEVILIMPIEYGGCDRDENIDCR